MLKPIQIRSQLWRQAPTSPLWESTRLFYTYSTVVSFNQFASVSLVLLELICHYPANYHQYLMYCFMADISWIFLMFISINFLSTTRGQVGQTSWRRISELRPCPLPLLCLLTLISCQIHPLHLVRSISGTHSSLIWEILSNLHKEQQHVWRRGRIPSSVTLSIDY